MADYLILVMLEFPAMPAPMPVRVSPRELYVLDREAERRVASDGTVIYSKGRPSLPVVYPEQDRRPPLPM